MKKCCYHSHNLHIPCRSTVQLNTDLIFLLYFGVGMFVCPYQIIIFNYTLSVFHLFIFFETTFSSFFFTPRLYFIRKYIYFLFFHFNLNEFFPFHPSTLCRRWYRMCGAGGGGVNAGF